MLAAGGDGGNLYVPGTVATIQGAIESALDGDTIIVSDGTYYEGIRFKGKSITVKSANGPEKCIIDGENSRRGVTFNGEDNRARLDGFTLRNGRATEGAGIHLESHSYATIANCVITANHTDYHAGGIYCYNSSPVITNCTISDNSANNGGGIACQDSSSPLITHRTVSGNTAEVEGGGIFVRYSSPTISWCTISGNTSRRPRDRSAMGKESAVMNIDWPKFVEIVRQHRTFLLTSHIRPDCDALGSELGMAAVLEALGKQVVIVNGQVTPPNLTFIDPERRIQALGVDVQTEQLSQWDLLMILDTSAWAQLGPMSDVIRSSQAR